MEKYNKIVVGLDLSKFDEQVLKYVNFFAKKVKATDLYFVHVEEEFYKPEDFPEEVRAAFIPMDEGEAGQIQSKVKDLIDADVNVHVDVLEGNATSVILHHIDTKGADLLVLGNKGNVEFQEVVPERLVAKSPVSVLLVPNNAPDTLDNIFVPFDFSEHSESAIETAQEFLNEDGKVSAFVGYEIPDGYYKTGKSYEEMVEIIGDHKKAKFAKTIGDTTKQLEVHFGPIEGRSAAREIVEVLNKDKYDMLIMGSRGRTKAAGILLGSTAKKVVENYDGAPMLILKKQGEHQGILDWLLS